MPEDLFHHLGEVARQVRAARHVFLFLDFDGTLAPIVPEPALAGMPESTRELLARLAAKPNMSVAMISGRGLPDLRKRVGLAGVIYAGDHGFAIEGAGRTFAEPVSGETRQALFALLERLDEDLAGVPGARVERKGFTASVHYRHVAEGRRAEVKGVVGARVAAAREMFGMTHGLEVLEIRPRVDWHKGAAARWILEASPYPGALPVCVGDDTTDEDAFRALREGITVRVGSEPETAAHYRIALQEKVETFLAWLEGITSPAGPRL